VLTSLASLRNDGLLTAEELAAAPGLEELMARYDS
tara:strand:- start:482 stop:586 length:105 start_codon:yes stop_codon:yes gene_type:complete